MLIESLAQKTKLALMTVLATIGGCTLICGFRLVLHLARDERTRADLHTGR